MSECMPTGRGVVSNTRLSNLRHEPDRCLPHEVQYMAAECLMFRDLPGEWRRETRRWIVAMLALSVLSMLCGALVMAYALG